MTHKGCRDITPQHNRSKIQISLRIRTDRSESLQGAYWIAKDAMFLHLDNEDSDQTALMRRLMAHVSESTVSHGPHVPDTCNQIVKYLITYVSETFCCRVHNLKFSNIDTHPREATLLKLYRLTS